MRIRKIGGTAARITAALVAASQTGAPASGAPASADTPKEPSRVNRPDNLPNPLAEARTELTKQAIADVVAGRATPVQRNGSEVVQVGRGRWAELKKKADKVDPIFTILVEFGDKTIPAAGGTAGPVHNQIAAPDRANDNSTYWTSNFDQAHFSKMINGPGESMADFYYKQSGGKYSVKGDVSDWVKVEYNEARYGSNNVAEANGYWNFVKDTAAAWYDSQIAAGKTPAEISAYLAQFDVWDRYDHDGDGNFNEPDGYIDHFQAIHAGEGEEAGGGAQGEDAIWSHRWYAFSSNAGSDGPVGNPLGGVPLGDSGIWIGDYTTEPENGGLGVFVHEYGHDLGLPDLYDTQGGDNGTGFWTVMSGGSWLNKGGDSIGTTPGYMGPWEKLFLGWLDYAVVEDGKTKLVTVGSAASPSGPLPQAVVVPLPPQEITTEWTKPYSGSFEWWGGSADDLNTTLTRNLDLTGATTAAVTTKAWYNIEAGYDYLYAEVSDNGGTSWTKLGTPVDGDSGGEWVDLTYDLSAFAGKAVQFRFRYQTDGGYHLDGPFLDDISVVKDGAVVETDTVEAGTGVWTANGFTRFGGTTVEAADHFYLAEYRTYTGYDKTLQTGPYNFGWANTRPDWVERFPYQDGLLVWYVNYAYSNNNTSGAGRAGTGLVLPVDARPAPVTFPDGVKLGNRRQPWDATFGLQKTDKVTFHRNGTPVTVKPQAAIPTFDDTDPNRYWSAANPWSSVKVAGDGVKISVWLELSGVLPVMLLQVKN